MIHQLTKLRFANAVKKKNTIKMFTAIFAICFSSSEKRKGYRLLMGKLEGKRPLGRPRRRWVDDVRMDLGEVG
jgi:hypothetical protein